MEAARKRQSVGVLPCLKFNFNPKFNLDLSITAGDDVAFCHYLYRVTGTMTNGSNVDLWLRSTICVRQIDGQWMITHEHTSVPFDPASGQASLEIQP